MHEEARSQPWVSHLLSISFYETEFLAGWDLLVAGWLVSDLPISTLQCYDYSQASVCLVFIWVLENMASSLLNSHLS